MLTDLTARKFADLIEGSHDLNELSHAEKVIRLKEIRIAWEAVQAAGWHEHTSDWDWRLTILTTHGLCFGTTDEGHWADSFNLYHRPHEPVEDNFTACVDHEKVGYIGVDIEDDRDPADGTIHWIEVDHIASVIYQQA